MLKEYRQNFDVKIKDIVVQADDGKNLESEIFWVCTF